MTRLANTRKKMTSLANNDDLMTINLSVCLWQVGGNYYLFFLPSQGLPKMAGKSQGLAETSQGRFSHLFKKVYAHVFGVYMYM